ncbi:MAG: vWA domain-containing protein [Bacteroidota bacterium]
MSFAFPYALLLLVFVPVWVLWYWRKHRPVRLPLTHAPERTVGAMGWLLHLPKALQLLAMVLMILALARPQVENKVVHDMAEGINLSLAIDVSESMQTRDLPPTRLIAARNVALNFIEGLEDDRVGLLLFSQQAYVYAPPTLDYEYLRAMLVDLQEKMLPDQGTALGDAIVLAVDQLKQQAGNSRAVVLLTDGAANSGTLSPEDAAKYAKENDIRLYPILIGQETTEGANAPDKKRLLGLARKTGGNFFSAENSQAIQAALGAVHTLERSYVGQRVDRETKDVFPQLLWPALLLLLIAWALAAVGIGNRLED